MSRRTPRIDALSQDASYPRPQLVRSAWYDLGGEWDFTHDPDATAGVGTVHFDDRIIVPFPPESPASGIARTDFLNCVWYRRTIGPNEFQAARAGDGSGRVIVHFGAVDHEATVWMNGTVVATHRGGQTPFSADITDAIDPAGDNELVVRAADPAEDVSILRGKQDWREAPHAIWYHRTTGIWQPVWLESVPSQSISDIAWSTDITAGTVDAVIRTRGQLPEGARLRVTVHHGDAVLAETTTGCLGGAAHTARLVVPRQLNGQQYEELLWSPDNPTLLGASVALENGRGDILDEVGSYLGLRSVSADRDRFLLNDRPVRVRAVLAQNYWPETHLAASAETLRREVELILDLGFNAARVHQKAEDPRFLYWADRLGLMVWAETASAYAFDDQAIQDLTTEWTALVRRDRSHPCVVTWVPLNESWGVQHLSHDPRQRALSRAVSDLTRALDGSRPVISNDGWEHTASDMLTIHDYDGDADALASRYAHSHEIDALVTSFGPAGRRLLLDDHTRALPVMVTEFGGVSLASDDEEEWGYSTAGDLDEFADRVCAIINAIETARPLAGYCYTQLTDTGQETNGLLRADRTPKIPVERVRQALGAPPR